MTFQDHPVASDSAKYVVNGGSRLTGTLVVQGAKNAVLPMIAAALLPTRGQTVLRNVPPLNDVLIQIALAEGAGAKIAYDVDERVLIIDPASVSHHLLDSGLTQKSRASVLFLPVLLQRLGHVEFRGVGGCALGPRSLDFHHNGFKRLGATVEGQGEEITIKAAQLKGNLVYLDTPSQTSTENLMMAACSATGTTIIENASSEPEIIDFGNLLTKMGAKIHGLGTRTMTIDGIRKFCAVEHTVMPDRLDAGAFIMASVMTRGDITLVGCRLEQMRVLVAKLEQMGAEITCDGSLVRARGPQRLRPINAISCPFPGFSTDFLPGLMALSTVAEGQSYFHETVFSDRFTQVPGLAALGASISQDAADRASVHGVSSLHGTQLRAPDLRAGMSLVIASLVAEGESSIDNIYQIERGHSDVVARLKNLGATINRSTMKPKG